jgi:hypothetical protein
MAALRAAIPPRAPLRDSSMFVFDHVGITTTIPQPNEN